METAYCVACREVASPGAQRIDPDGELRCLACHEARFATCEACGDTITREDVQSGPNGTDFCEGCYDDRFATCYHCQITISRDFERWAHGELYCERCFYQRFVYCVDCGEVVGITETYDDGYCESCWNEQGPETGAWEDVWVSPDEVATVKDLIRRELARPETSPPTGRWCVGRMSDPGIPDLIDRLGQVPHPVYLYGIRDAHGDDYWVSPALPLPPPGATWSDQHPHPRARAVGIALSLRTHHREAVLAYLSHVTGKETTCVESSDITASATPVPA